MFNLKQTETENQEYILSDNFSRITLGVFYLILIFAGILFYNFVIVQEVAKVKMLGLNVEDETIALWIKIILGFFFIPAFIMITLGIKILFEKRYPSLGAKVAVKTKIIRGKKARNLGIKYLVFGIFTIFIILTSMDRTIKMQKNFAEDPFRWATEKAWNKAGMEKPEQYKKNRPWLIK